MLGPATNLKQVLQNLERMKENNNETYLSLSLPGVRLGRESQDLLSRILSHQHSKVTDIELVESAPNALVSSEVTRLVKRWCAQVPANGPRTLRFVFRPESSEKNNNALEELRDALTIPNNRVEHLVMYTFGTKNRVFDLLLRPVLQHPSNELKALELKAVFEFSDEEGLALGAGLAHQNSRLKLFSATYVQDYQFNGALSLLNGLYVSSCLENLEWGQLMLNNEVKSKSLHRLTRMLTREGNKLSRLIVRMKIVEQNQVATLAEALADEHCVLEDLRLYASPFVDDVFLPLASVLCRPGNRLKSVTARLRGALTASAVGECLKSPNCILESLDLAVNIGPVDGIVAVAIAHALKLSSSNRLRRLTLGGQPVNAFRALAESLRSRFNKITELHLQCVQELDDSSRNQFYRALRVSNVTTINREVGYFSSFYRAMNAPFFLVLHTLLSLKHVPRLGKTSPLRQLPIQDLIIRIAETLGWPLDDLRLN